MWEGREEGWDMEEDGKKGGEDGCWIYNMLYNFVSCWVVWCCFLLIVWDCKIVGMEGIIESGSLLKNMWC